MRLIDADAIKYREYLEPMGNGMYVHVGIVDDKEIDAMPTIEAVSLERDIPKAPTDKELEEDAYGAWGSLYGHCPNCKGTVYDEQNYCEKCGQRLDWSREQGILETTRNYSKRENGDPNGFNDETVQALKDTTDRKNLSKVYDTLDDMYADISERGQIRHGKWIGKSTGGEHFYCCSECGEHVLEIGVPWFKYCPNCGAKMDAEPRDSIRSGQNMREIIVKVNGFQREGHEPVLQYERELIRCKDCKHWDGDDCETFCSELGIFGTDPNSFCSYAKRKEE